MSKFFGIGVGPGDPEYLTLKAYRILQSAETVYAPSGKDGNPGIAYSIVKDYIPKETKILAMDFPMIDLKANRCGLIEIWKRNALKIHESLKDGDVVFLTLGDPSIFSTYSYILDYLKDKEIEVETIPGISSFSAMAARLNLPLTQDDQSLAVVSLTKEKESLSEILSAHDVIVIMKVSADPVFLYDLLRKLGLKEHFILISHIATSKEMVSTDIEILKKDIPYMSTVYINKERKFHEF